MANNVIGSLLVNLGLETGRLKSDTDKAARHFNNFEKKSKRSLSGIGKTVGRLTTSVVQLTGAAGALSVAGLGAVTVASVNAADKVGKLSARIGASTEALSEYKHVADLSGVSFETLTMGWQRMTRRISEAANGMGEARGALGELGLSAQQLNRMRPEMQFEILADALNGVTNEADKVRLAMKLFDSEGVSLIQTMGEGAQGIREMRREANDLGLTLTKLDTENAAAAVDAMTRLKGSVSGLTLSLSKELGPVLADIADDFADSLPQSIQLAKNAMDSFWLVVDPSRASITGQLKGISKEISGITSEIVDLTNSKVGLSLMQTALIDEQIGEKRRELRQLQADYDTLAGQIDSKRGMILNINPDAGGGAKDEDVFGAGFVDDNKTRQDALRGAQQAEFNILMEFEDAKTQLVRDGVRERLEFTQWGASQQTKHIVSELVSVTRGATRENRKLFELNKAAGIANAIINTHQGVTKSLSSYPWPIAGVMAAIHLASGMAQVQAIKGTSFGSGGGAPSFAASGGTPSNPVIQDNPAVSTATPQTTADITIQGDNFSAEGVRDLLDKINDALGDGAELNVTVAA